MSAQNVANHQTLHIGPSRPHDTSDPATHNYVLHRIPIPTSKSPTPNVDLDKNIDTCNVYPL